MKKIITTLAFSALMLAACSGAKDISGKWDYVGFNGLSQSEEIWALEIAEDQTSYTLSLRNDFLNSINYGTIAKNDDDTYTLTHDTTNEPDLFPYPQIVYGFSKVGEENGKEIWQAVGEFDFENRKFIPEATEMTDEIITPGGNENENNTSTGVNEVGGLPSVAGTYTFKGYNGMSGQAEDNELIISEDADKNLTYALKKVMMTPGGETTTTYTGTVEEGEGLGKFILVHVSSDAGIGDGYPTIVFGFSNVGTDEAPRWTCPGTLDIMNKTFTPDAELPQA